MSSFILTPLSPSALAADGWERSLVQGWSMQAMGNVSLSASKQWSSFDGGDMFALEQGLDLLSQISMADPTDNTHPWTIIERAHVANFSSDTFGFGYGLISELDARATRDALSLFRVLGNVDPPTPSTLELGLYLKSLRYETVDAEFLVLQRGPWRAWVRGGFIAAERLDQLTATGHGRIDDEADVAFYLDFTSASAENGTGWTTSGGLQYETDAFSLTVDTHHLASRITWPEVHVRKGLANNKTQVTGPDGYPSFAPFIRGTYSTESWQETLSPRWRLTFEPKRTRHLTAVHLDQKFYETRLTSVWSLNPNVQLMIGLSAPARAVHLGVTWDVWSVGIAAGHLSLDQTPSLKLEVRRRWL